MGVGVLDHLHRHASRHGNTGVLEGGVRVGQKLRLEGRIAPRPGDDLAGGRRVVLFRLSHWKSFRLLSDTQAPRRPRRLPGRHTSHAGGFTKLRYAWSAVPHLTSAKMRPRGHARTLA